MDASPHAAPQSVWFNPRDPKQHPGEARGAAATQWMERTGCEPSCLVAVETPAANEAPADGLTEARRPHLVVMDDSPAILDLMRDLFEPEGYRVSTFSSVLDPDQLKRLAPDVLLLDAVFGGHDDGWRFVAAAREDDGLLQVPIVVCTGASRAGDRGEELASRDVGLVLKPFEIDHLLDEVAARLAPLRALADA